MLINIENFAEEVGRALIKSDNRTIILDFKDNSMAEQNKISNQKTKLHRGKGKRSRSYK